MRVNTRYINSTRGTSSKTDAPKWRVLYPTFQAHSVTQVCTGIKHNSFLFKTGHSPLISKLAQHIITQIHTPHPFPPPPTTIGETVFVVLSVSVVSVCRFLRAWVKVVVVWEGQGVPLMTSPSPSSPAPWRIKAAVWPSDDVSTGIQVFTCSLFVITLQPTFYPSPTL